MWRNDAARYGTYNTQRHTTYSIQRRGSQATYVVNAYVVACCIVVHGASMRAAPLVTRSIVMMPHNTCNVKAPRMPNTVSNVRCQVKRCIDAVFVMRDTVCVKTNAHPPPPISKMGVPGTAAVRLVRSSRRVFTEIVHIRTHTDTTNTT